MDEASRDKWHRESQLDALTSVELGQMIADRGYRMGARQNKTNRKFAVLHLEKYAVTEEVVIRLKLEPI